MKHQVTVEDWYRLKLMACRGRFRGIGPKLYRLINVYCSTTSIYELTTAQARKFATAIIQMCDEIDVESKGKS